MKIRIPVFQQNSLNERILRSGLVSQLRATPFTTGLITGTEMTVANGYAQNNYGYYEFEILGADLTKLLKLYVSADNVTFEQITTWGGTDGIRQKEYLVYSALLTQSGTNAPVATVLENTLGLTPTWSYTNTGQYSLTSTGLFLATKTAIVTSWGIASEDSENLFSLVRNNNDSLFLSSATGDDRLINTFIEFRIYP